MPELPDWTETERVRQQEKERFVRITRAYASSFWETRDGAFFRFVRIAGLHIKTNTGGRNEYPQKITEKE